MPDANGIHNGAQQTPKLSPGPKKTNASSWNVFQRSPTKLTYPTFRSSENHLQAC